MDNIQKDLFGAIDDLINNRVKDINGNIVKYDDRDREIYIKVFNDIKHAINFNENKIDKSSYELLISFTDKVLETIKNKNI